MRLLERALSRRVLPQELFIHAIIAHLFIHPKSCHATLSYTPN
jgi:hypothetical protein